MKSILNRKYNLGLRDRAANFEFTEKIKLASKKLLVLIPDTCFCTPSFQDMAPCGQIERVKVISLGCSNRNVVKPLRALMYQFVCRIWKTLSFAEPE